LVTYQSKLQTRFTHFSSSLVKYEGFSCSQNPFLRPLNCYYLRNKINKPTFVVLTLNDLFNINVLKDKLSKSIDYNVLYTVSIKIRFKDTFHMAGSQFGYIHKEHVDFLDLNRLINERVFNLFEVYSFSDDDLLYIQLTFKKVNYQIISDFSDSTKTGKAVQGHGFNPPNDGVNNLTLPTSNIPISIDENTLGISLAVKLNENNKIVYIELVVESKDGLQSINFLDKISSKANLLKFGHSDKIDMFDNK